MISGRYRTEMMSRFWTANSSGFCLAATCHHEQGTLEHLLVSCPALEHTRHGLHSLWCRKTLHLQPLHCLIIQILSSGPEVQVKFILDSLAFPQLCYLVQLYGQSVLELVLYLTRTWAYAIHRQKLKLLGKWPTETKSGQINSKKANNDNDYSCHEPNNLISNVSICPAIGTLPHCSTTPLPASSTPPPTGCASSQRSTILLPATTTPLPAGYATQYPCSSSTPLPPSTTAIPCDVEFVPSEPTTSLQPDQPSDAMPRPICITIHNQSPSVNCVVGLEENLTGHRRGHRVMDCSPSSVAGHQQPELPNSSVSLSVTPIAITVACAVSLS